MRYVVLLRGINVGGHHSLPMKDLREILQSLGYEGVRTYIQSGNVVLTAGSPPDGTAISAAVEERFGFSPRVLVIPGPVFEAVAEGNPYEDDVSDPKHLHISFLAGPASPDLDAMKARQGPNERYTLTADALYLHAPEGIGRSKFAADAERLLGVEATGRNLNTVRRIAEMLR